jgi:hypothetical protein
MLRAVSIFAHLIFVLFVSACAEPPKEPSSPSPTEAIALATRVLHCELAAADCYDDGHSQQICSHDLAACWLYHPL